IDFNDEFAPQRNDLGFGSAEESLGAQPTEADPMNEENVEAPPMVDLPQTEESGCLRVYHHAPICHLENEPTIARDLIMLTCLDRISLSAEGDVLITEGNWSLPKLVEIFKKNFYQDEEFFNSMKTGGQGNSLSLVKLVNFYVGKLEKYNDSIQNARPAEHKKNAMSALYVAHTYMLYVLGTFLLSVKKGSYVTARYLYLFEKDKANIKWSWGSAVLTHLFHNLGAASQTGGKQFAAYTTLLESWIFVHFPKLPVIPKQQHSDAAEYCTRWKCGLSIIDRTGSRDLLKYREAFDNYKVEDVVWDPYRVERWSDHDFNENTFFNRLTFSLDHVKPIYPNRVVRQFARIQPILKNPKCVEGLWKEWIMRSRNRGRRLRGGPAQCVDGYMKWFQSVPWTKIYPPTVDLSVDDDIGLSACHPIGRLRNKPDNCDIPMEVSGELPNVCEHEQYLMLRDENKALVGQISALKEEVQKLKDQKNGTSLINKVHTNDYIQTKECEALNERNAKLVKDLRIQAAVDDCNASLSRELAKKRREYKLLQDINAKLADQSERQHPTPIPEAWRQAMKKEFHSGELAEKDDPTFIKLFDQYDKFYTIAQQGTKGDYQDDFTVTGGNQDKLMEVRRVNVVLMKKINETLFQLYVKYHLNVRGVQGEDDNSAFRVPTTNKYQSQNQFKKVMNSLESLMTKYPTFRKTIFSQSLDTPLVLKVMVFISNHEA
ncbi:hypothetical protein GIB67_040064, partial [Kingdonia uniflora]